MSAWFIKYKLYHIPFWIVYHILWLWINTGYSSVWVSYLFLGETPVKFIGYIVFQAAAAYFNLYYLIPKFLYPGKYAQYVVLVILTILAASALIVSGYYLNAYVSAHTFSELFGQRAHPFLHIFSTAALPSTAGSMTLAMSIKLGKNWLSSERKRLVLEKDHLETELKYLKSQINPHFLFNTINSIFVLIHKNPDFASESLASFSEMIRYQLYECNDREVLLKKELHFLENFIELESLRLNENQTKLEFDIAHESAQGVSIAPFVLLPFVENAFKHVSKGKTRENFIKLGLCVDENKMLTLRIENSTHPDQARDAGGIGLQNVQRRLNLVYPGRHRLDIGKEENTFKILLTLELQ